MQRHDRAHQRHARNKAIARAKRTACASRDGERSLLRNAAAPVWGRYAKRHYLDCGRTRCGLCHWGKHVGRREPTLQERRHRSSCEDSA